MSIRKSLSPSSKNKSSTAVVNAVVSVIENNSVVMNEDITVTVLENLRSFAGESKERIHPSLSWFEETVPQIYKECICLGEKYTPSDATHFATFFLYVVEGMLYVNLPIKGDFQEVQNGGVGPSTKIYAGLFGMILMLLLLSFNFIANYNDYYMDSLQNITKLNTTNTNSIRGFAQKRIQLEATKATLTGLDGLLKAEANKYFSTITFGPVQLMSYYVGYPDALEIAGNCVKTLGILDAPTSTNALGKIITSIYESSSFVQTTFAANNLIAAINSNTLQTCMFSEIDKRISDLKTQEHQKLKQIEEAQKHFMDFWNWLTQNEIFKTALNSGLGIAGTSAIGVLLKKKFGKKSPTKTSPTHSPTRSPTPSPKKSPTRSPTRSPGQLASPPKLLAITNSGGARKSKKRSRSRKVRTRKHYRKRK